MKCVKDIFLQYEKIGFFSRINEEVWPTAFKCATVSTDELHLLRKVKNIVRRGRIESLEHDKIIFKDKRFANHSTNYYRLHRYSFSYCHPEFKNIPSFWESQYIIVVQRHKQVYCLT